MRCNQCWESTEWALVFFFFWGFFCVCVDLETQSTRRSAMPVVVPPSSIIEKREVSAYQFQGNSKPFSPQPGFTAANNRLGFEYAVECLRTEAYSQMACWFVASINLKRQIRPFALYFYFPPLTDADLRSESPRLGCLSSRGRP